MPLPEIIGADGILLKRNVAGYSRMNAISVELFRARDSEDSFAIRKPGEQGWRAMIGFGSDFEKVWKLEFEGTSDVNEESLSWEALLGRAIEAYNMSDPVVTDMKWQKITL
jgi:hypothetical protein